MERRRQLCLRSEAQAIRRDGKLCFIMTDGNDIVWAQQGICEGLILDDCVFYFI